MAYRKDLRKSFLDYLVEYDSADLAKKVKRGMTNNVINGKMMVALGQQKRP